MGGKILKQNLHPPELLGAFEITHDGTKNEADDLPFSLGEVVLVQRAVARPHQRIEEERRKSLLFIASEEAST